MAAVDLSVEELSDAAVSYLGELLAPISSFEILPESNSRVKSTGTGGGVYQVEVTGTRPATGDNAANYVTDLTSGTQTNVTVTTAEVANLQTLTRLQIQQGIPFKTRVIDAAKGYAEGIWDKVTAMMGAASYTDAGALADPASVTVAEIQSLRAAVDALDVTLMVEHSTSAALYPSDKNSFQFAESGAYGYNRIFPVSNFTGGVANQAAFACSTEAAVAVTGDPLRDQRYPDIGGKIIERLPIEGVGLNVEMVIWEEQNTEDIHVVLRSIFGISEADSSAGAYLDHV